MSELVSVRIGRKDYRRKLLTTASTLTMLAAICGWTESKAADQDADRPTIWIELGSQLMTVNGQGDPFVPTFLAAHSDSAMLQSPTPIQAQNPSPFSFSGQGKISFQPKNSDWTLAAAVTFGRSSSFKHVDHQTSDTFVVKYDSGVPGPTQNLHGTENFADTQVHHRESHAIIDFSAGKDVGLGLFGRNVSSTLNLGVRFAQFQSKTTFDVRARPDLQFKYAPYPTYHITFKLPYFHTYHATGQASRSFHGVGPSLSWNGSVPVLGSSQQGEVLLDWGANAAVLFGRQKSIVQHQEIGHYWSPHFVFEGGYSTVDVQPLTNRNAARSVVVPNVGGFAGASYRIENFKISAGYRADFFFGAIDGGIDTRKSETLGFHGPFASVSVGLGG